MKSFYIEKHYMIYGGQSQVTSRFERAWQLIRWHNDLVISTCTDGRVNIYGYTNHCFESDIRKLEVALDEVFS